MKKTTLSVIVPCYNDGKYLREALESLEGIKGINYETIIIDDGSNDKTTLNILRELKKTKEYRVFRQVHKGPSSARNLGIKNSKGEFLLLLDADNKIDPDYVKYAIDILQKNPSIGVVYSDVQFFGEEEKIVRVPEFNIKKILSGNYIDTCAIIRKKVWEDVGGFDTNLDKYTWEDWVFWIDAYYKGWGFYHIPKVLFYYRVKKNSRDKIQENEKIREKLLNYIGKKYGKNIYKEYRELYEGYEKLHSVFSSSKNFLKFSLNLIVERLINFLRMVKS